jgi:two-component system chemotaxis response regulator CheB
VLIGASAGGLTAVQTVLRRLPRDFPWPVVVVQHLGQADDIGGWLALYAVNSALPVTEARDRAPLKPGVVHLAPAGYHLLVERTQRFALSADEKIRYVRPSIDVLFSSAADAYRAGCIGVILTGANDDGARGLKSVRSRGGLALVQDPAEAEVPQMPRAALELAGADDVLTLDAIGRRLAQLAAA